jgi:hypothetical protein
MQLIPFLNKDGGFIYVDIGGQPYFPTISKQFSSNFGNLLFLAVFHFRSRFEALNDIFWENEEKYRSSFVIHSKMNLLDNIFPTVYHAPKTKIVCKSYDPGSFMY